MENTIEKSEQADSRGWGGKHDFLQHLKSVQNS